MAVIPGALTAGLMQRGQPLLATEAVIGLAHIDQLFGKFQIAALALALHIGAIGAADVGTLVPLQADVPERIVNDSLRALDMAFAVGILDTENKAAAVFFGDEECVKRRPEIANMHIAGRAGREAGADVFHIFPPCGRKPQYYCTTWRTFYQLTLPPIRTKIGTKIIRVR